MAHVCNFIINFFFFYFAVFFIETVGQTNQLEIYFFNVGQANFSLLKTQTEALVVDCGTKRKTELVKSEYVHIKMKRQVREILGTIKPTILISHMDDDHYCGLNDFFPKEKRKKVIVGGIPTNSKLISLDLRKDDVFFAENKYHGKIVNYMLEKQCGLDTDTFIKDSLSVFGNKPEILCLLPEINESEERNDQSLVIKINYAGRSILITGDAGNDLLTRIASSPTNADCFKNIDLVLFPHHGSNEREELSILEKIINGAERPTLGIISSKAKGASYIPKYFPNSSDDETFLDKFDKIATLFPIIIPNTKRYCAYHNISMYDKSIDEVYESPAISSDGKNIIPVFSTGDLEDNLYYKIVIQPDGKKLTMTDQSGTILYQLVDTLPLDTSIPQPIEFIRRVGVGISRLTRTAFKCKIDTAKAINPYAISLAKDTNSLPTSASITEEITALMEIQKSGYLAKVTVLDRLLKLMINVFSNIQVSGNLLQFRIDTTGILESFDWANFLLCNKFFKTEKLTKESLANLVCACVPKIISTTTTSSSSSSSSSSSNPQYYTKEEILEFFKEFGPHIKETQIENGGTKRGIFIGKNLFEQMELPEQTLFLKWVEEKLWMVPSS